MSANSLDLPYCRHSDRFDTALEWPLCLRWWLLIHRLPAGMKMIAREALGVRWPECYARHEGRWVKLCVASRFGDVGITHDLSSDQYNKRVAVDQLSDFTDQKSSASRNKKS